MTFTSFEIEVVESTGALGKPGTPFLICRTAAALPHGDANVFILAYNYRQQKWDQYYRQLSPNEVESVIERLKNLGIPKRLPKVEGVHLTAKFWINFSLKIKLDDKTFYLDLSAAEGMRGKDAAALSELFEYLFSLAGYKT